MYFRVAGHRVQDGVVRNEMGKWLLLPPSYFSCTPSPKQTWQVHVCVCVKKKELE